MTHRVEQLSEDVTLYLGDCREILPTLGKVDAVVTDPPYGISAAKKGAHSSIRDNTAWENKTWDDERPDEELLKSLSKFPEAALWGGNYFADFLPASPAWLVWRKPQAETGFSLADVELCWTNKRFAARTVTVVRRDGGDHPTQKPVEVMRWTLSFIKGRTILDPFMGSGTTGVACVQLGRKFIGIELEPRYFDIAVKRISDELKRPRLDLGEPVAKPVQEVML